MKAYTLTHLQELESEAIFVMREVVSQFENPVLLFSGGKDSIVCAHIARKSFYPAKIPFPLMHIDTGHNFPETIEFRDKFIRDFSKRLSSAVHRRRKGAGRKGIQCQQEHAADGDIAGFT